MNILFSANYYPTENSPLQAFIGVICRELVCQGHQVTVVAPQSLTTCIKNKIPIVNTHYLDQFYYNGQLKWVDVYRPFVITFGQGKFAKITALIKRFVVSRKARLLKKNFDVVYCHFWHSASNMIPYIEQTRIPLIVATGEDEIRLSDLVGPKTIHRLNKNTKGVICVSTKNKQESIQKIHIDPELCIVLPNAYNDADFYPMDKMEVRKQLNFPIDAFIISFCGRFSTRKGMDRLCAAISEIDDSTINSIFIGMPSEGSLMYPGCEGVLFSGKLPHDEICKYLNCSDVFVLPSLAEGCSNSIVEAMACGLPIISSDLPFNHDILDKTNAILVDPLCVDSIKEAIIRIRLDRKLRERLSNGSLSKAKDMTIKVRVSKIINFISEKIDLEETTHN